MKIAPIRSSEDHRAALDRVDELWGAEMGTPEGDLLDVLVDLVEHYETKLLGPVRAQPASPSGRARTFLGQREATLAALRASPRDAIRKRQVNVIRAMRRHPELWGDAWPKPTPQGEPQAA